MISLLNRAKLGIMYLLTIVDNLLCPNKIVILLYHKIVEEKPLAGSIAWIRAKDFEEQVLELKRLGYKFVTLDKTVEMLSQNEIKGKYVTITFDDGFIDNYEVAFPLIEKYELPVAIFVCPQYFSQKVALKFADYNWIIVQDKDTSVVERFISWEQLREMRDFGVEIANHSYRHVNVCRVSLKESCVDIEKCSQEINKNIGLYPKYFSYPFGMYDDKSVEQIKRLGFKAAFIVEQRIVLSKPVDLFRIPRVGISGDMPLPFFCFMLTRYSYHYSLLQKISRLFNFSKKREVK